MNSIVLTHVAAPAPDVSHLEIALDRLGAWLDSERETVRAMARRWFRVASSSREPTTAASTLRAIPTSPMPLIVPPRLGLGPSATSQRLVAARPRSAKAA